MHHKNLKSTYGLFRNDFVLSRLKSKEQNPERKFNDAEIVNQYLMEGKKYVTISYLN